MPPRPLPAPPAAEGLLHVLCYSFKICVTADAWALPRLAAVFGLLFVSRVASEPPNCPWTWRLLNSRGCMH